MELKCRADDRRQIDLGGQEAAPGMPSNGASKWIDRPRGGSADTTTNTSHLKEQGKSGRASTN